MKEPERPYKEYVPSHLPDEIDRTLSSVTYLHDEWDKQSFIDDWQDQNESTDVPNIEDWSYSNTLMSLQDILDQVPPGTDPKNIIVSMHRDRQIYYVEVRVSIREPFNKLAHKAKQRKAEQEYQEKLKIYEAEKKKYDIWFLESQLEKIKVQLSELEK